MAERPDLAVEPVSRRAGLVAKGKPRMSPRQLVDQLANRLRPVGDGAEEPHLATPSALGQRHRNRLLARVKPNVGRILLHGSSPMPEALIGTARSTLDAGMQRNEPLLRSRTWGLKLGMDRYVLSDAQWAKMQPHCLGKKSDPGRSGEDNRRFVEAVLWIARTGSPWRDLPPLFGPWNTVFKRYRDWVKADVFKRLFDAASEEPDMEYAMVDATIVKVHRHGQGAKGGLRARPSANPRAA